MSVLSWGEYSTWLFVFSLITLITINYNFLNSLQFQPLQYLWDQILGSYKVVEASCCLVLSWFLWSTAEVCVSAGTESSNQYSQHLFSKRFSPCGLPLVLSVNQDEITSSKTIQNAGSITLSHEKRIITLLATSKETTTYQHIFSLTQNDKGIVIIQDWLQERRGKNEKEKKRDKEKIGINYDTFIS